MGFVITVLLFGCLQLAAQVGAAGAPAAVEQARKLESEQRWQDVVLMLEPMPSRSAEMDFHYGTALAKLERWREAEEVFQAGFRLAPRDPRFSIELAGTAFRQKHYSQAANLLRRAIRLDPHDSYANDFLGTVYFLEGNLEASLKYWNRAGKPGVVELREDPLPRVSPALLDRAFTFSPASTMELAQFLDTRERLGGLEIFPSCQIALAARDAGQFDAWFRSQERNGFGRTRWEGLFLLLRGLPFSSATPSITTAPLKPSILFRRADAQKRRVFARISAHRGQRKYRFSGYRSPR
jgi:tetratricopeptide (TPR) repeat protein